MAAALVGVLATGAALGFGHLVAAILLVSSASPFLAVGNAAIDRTPTPVKEWAVDQFGTNDKLVLLLGVAGVVTVVAVVAGLVSRRRLWPGLAVVVAIGVLGILAVLEQAGDVWAALAPVVSLLVAAGVFAGYTHWLRDPPPPTRPGRTLGMTMTQPAGPRRGLPVGVGSWSPQAGSPPGPRWPVRVVSCCTAGSTWPRPGGRWARCGRRNPRSRSRPAPTSSRPAHLRSSRRATSFTGSTSTCLCRSCCAEDAVLRITGMVDREIELTFAEIRERPLVEKTITMTCVSNRVGGELVSTSNFIGVPLSDLLDEAGVRSGATQLVGHSEDGFTIGTPLKWVTDPQRDALLAIGMNREPLLAEHGFPMRTVIAGLYGYVSATKWVTELELTTFDVEPYWERRGWDGDTEGIAPIKTSSRIDAPGPFARVPAGPVTIAGTAWAQTRGIAKVEVQVDNGPWRPAELAAEVNPNTWRMWRVTTQQLDPGNHQVTVRATDRSGDLQTADRANPINPGTDGSTGRHTVTFTAD